MEKKTSLSINGISMTWNDSNRRVEKPCKKCGEPTTGRSVNGGGIKVPACCGCAISMVMDKALAIFGRKD